MACLIAWGVTVNLAPRSAEAQCNAYWDNTTGMPGFNLPSQGQAIYDDGNGPRLYVGGEFTVAQGQAAGGVARWNGSNSWTPTKTAGGMNDWVYTLATYDDGTGSGPELYAGGVFTMADGVVVNHIAKWNGVQWRPVGDGFNEDVWYLHVHDDGSGKKLYACGDFTASGTETKTLKYLACWDGSTWEEVGGSLNRTAYVAYTHDDGSGPALFVGGNFFIAGSTTAFKIAKWNGSTWSALGSGCTSDVWVMHEFDDGTGKALYVGGQFSGAGGQPRSRIARWKNGAWSSVGSGLDDTAWSMAVYDDGSGGGPALFVGGRFLHAGVINTTKIAKWNGSTWSPVGLGVNSGLHHLLVWDNGDGNGDVLYAAGDFSAAGGALTRYHSRLIAPRPRLIDHPVSLNLTTGQTAIFEVNATGAGLSYQWRKGGENIANGGSVSGATSAQLLIANVVIADSGVYDVVISNACGSITSKQATLTVSDCVPCDVNCDGSVNPFDIQAFVDLLGGAGSPCSPCAGDANLNGTANPFDIGSFLTCLGT